MAEDEQQRYGIYRDEIKIYLNAHYCKKKTRHVIKRKLFLLLMLRERMRHAFVSKDCYVSMGEFETLDINLL